VLLTGEKGVGKTTIMICMALIVSLLCPNVLPVYHNYKTDSKNSPVKPTLLMIEAANLANFPVYHDSIMDIFSRQNKIVMLFVDDIQVLYETSGDIGAECIANLKYYGKAHPIPCIASGSTKARKFAYNNNNSPYPSLIQIFTDYRITPLREKQTFTEAVLTLDKNASDEQTQKLYYLTGGIRQRIKQARDRHDYEIVQRDKFKNLLVDKELLEVLCQLWLVNQSSDIWNTVGISKDKLRARGLLKNIPKWIDTGLYEDVNYVYFLCPWHKDIIGEYMPYRKTIVELETILLGWDVENIEEERCMVYICNNLAKHHNLKFLDRKLIMNESTTKMLIEGHDTEEVDIPAILGELLRVSRDQDTDMILISENETKRDEYLVRLYHIKLGWLENEIRLGYFGRPERHTFAGIVEGAKAGWTELLDLLHYFYPESTFKPTGFTLVTTKNIHHNVKQWYEKDKTTNYKPGMYLNDTLVPIHFFDQESMCYSEHFGTVQELVKRFNARMSNKL
jgi:hypothetical protein